MRKVNTRDLRNNLSKNLKDLPFVITKRGDDIAIVKSLEGEVTEKDMKKAEEYAQTCNHGYPSHLCTKCKKRG